MKGDTSQNLIGLLEQRLDMIVYRAKFAPTIFAARQLVNHGHVLVDGEKCNIGSRPHRSRARPCRAAPKAQEMALVMEAQSLAERDILDYAVAGRRLEDHLHARADPRRGAVSGEDGAEPGGRVLQPLMPGSGASRSRPWSAARPAAAKAPTDGAACRGADPEGNEKRGGPRGRPFSCRGDRTAVADVRSGPVPGFRHRCRHDRSDFVHAGRSAGRRPRDSGVALSGCRFRARRGIADARRGHGAFRPGPDRAVRPDRILAARILRDGGRAGGSVRP